LRTYATPGVYREETFKAPPRALATGVPAFLGAAGAGPAATPAAFAAWPRLVDLLRRRESLTTAEAGELDAVGTRAKLELWAGEAAGSGWHLVADALEAEGWPSLEAMVRIDRWAEFTSLFGAPVGDGHLAEAVHGFFDNGGEECYVVRLDLELPPLDAYGDALEALAFLPDVDLVCAPDATQPPLAEEKQRLVLGRCDASGTMLAILDSLPGATVGAVLAQRARLVGTNGALYYPWVAEQRGRRFVPPCGHVAGVYARSDRRFGPHKAPANEILEGVLDLEAAVDDASQADLNEAGVNALRAFRGRGIRVWGARTLSDEPAWRYVSVRRIFLTAARWLEQAFPDASFEPNDAALWARTRLTLSRYFTDLFRLGALKGASPNEAFYVKCDGGNNPPEERDAGRLFAEVGLAPAVPNEFVVVHITRTVGGVTITGPTPG
jgi:hypothetical protein